MSDAQHVGDHTVLPGVQDEVTGERIPPLVGLSSEVGMPKKPEAYSGSSKVAATVHGAPVCEHGYSLRHVEGIPVHMGTGKLCGAGNPNVAKSEAWHPVVPEGRKLDDVSLDEWVGQAIGTASTCWLGMPDDLVFDSQKAAAIADALLSQFKLMLKAFVDESERRRKVSDGYLREQLAKAGAGPTDTELDAIKEMYFNSGYAAGKKGALEGNVVVPHNTFDDDAYTAGA